MTMQVLGLKRVRIDALSLPGNWKEILSSEETQRLAKSIERDEQIHEPLVRKSDMRLIVGRRRVASHAVIGLEDVVVKLVEATDAECARLEIVENLERHHYTDGELSRMTKRLVDLQEMELAGTPVPPPRSRGGRGHRSIRGEAREMVAQQRGIKPESVKRAEERASAAEREAANEPTPPPIHTFGLQIGDEFAGQVTLVTHMVTEALRHARSSQTLLANLANSEAPTHTSALDVVREKVADAIARIKGHMPKMLCPACKGMEALTPKCVSCHGTAYITEAQLDNVPKELLDEDNLRVFVNRKYEPLSKYLPDEPEPEQRVDWFGEDEEPGAFDEV